jgi:hypothetical protein
MVKKLAVITVEFDDPEDNFEDASDFATYVEGKLDDLNGLEVLVYSTPSALAADTTEGLGIFAENRENAGVPIRSAAEEAHLLSSGMK